MLSCVAQPFAKYIRWFTLMKSIGLIWPIRFFGHCKGTFFRLNIICVTGLYLFSKAFSVTLTIFLYSFLNWLWQNYKKIKRLDVKKGWIEKKENHREIMFSSCLARYSKRYVCKMSFREPGSEFCSTMQLNSYIRKQSFSSDVLSGETMNKNKLKQNRFFLSEAVSVWKTPKRKEKERNSETSSHSLRVIWV